MTSFRPVAGEADWTFGGAWPYEPRWFDTPDGRLETIVTSVDDPRVSYHYHGFGDAELNLRCLWERSTGRYVKVLFDDDVLLKYSQIERVPTAADVRHPLLREALRMTGTERRVEISSMADIPANTGLGTTSVGALSMSGTHSVRSTEAWDWAAGRTVSVVMSATGLPDKSVRVAV